MDTSNKKALILEKGIKDMIEIYEGRIEQENKWLREAKSKIERQELEAMIVQFNDVIIYLKRILEKAS